MQQSPSPRPHRPSSATPNSLAGFNDTDFLGKVLPASGQWHPVPDVSDRAFWNAVDSSTREAILRRAEEFRAREWPVLTARGWRDFVETGNRTRYEDRYFARRRRTVASALAACLTDDPGWHDDVLDGVWLMLEETTWCVPAHDFSAREQGPRLPDPDRPFLDLFAAETGALLAWTLHVLGARLDERSPLVGRRIVEEVRRRILVPQRTDDTWSWFGRSGPVNNWNPWINSNVLTCSLLLDKDRDDLVTTVSRVLEGLDVFVSGYPDDGGCDEGQMYWWRAGASLSECLEQLYDATGGALDGYAVPKVHEIARYPHRVHIADDWYVNVGDGPARTEAADTVEPHVLYRFGRRVGDDEAAAHARYMRGDGAVTLPRLSLGRSLFALADRDWSEAAPSPAPLVAQAWWPQTQLLTARETGGRAEGLFVSVKGGHNGESHNHNDVGTVLVAVDGHPALVDAGVAQYTRQHFGPRRYEIWTMRSDYHNVPNVDGHEQLPGSEFRARDVTADLGPERIDVRLDLAGAYPKDAGLVHWWRRVRFERGEPAHVRWHDEWELDHEPNSITLHLITSAEPALGGETEGSGSTGTIRVPTPGRALRIAYDASAFPSPVVERIDLDDRRLSGVWGPALWRIALSPDRPGRRGEWTLDLRAEPGA
ncbi:Heparinase II/III-like protein [Actinopolymorpha singaporensis]|uniref:Heparinase II/III-like protein n=1 Tax=Actinopolymorpha singaporensis TaxID=117157 RepID=A0A1H1RFG1_9ACTN|nr:Heparinase II/III-like protein [Actinopolymorpha singaporensis]